MLPFIEGVAAIDAGCWRGRTGPRVELAEVRRLASDHRGRGRNAGLNAALSATDLSESVWESASRVVIRQLGFPAPVLQQPFVWGRRVRYRTDFWWPDQGVIGEFDGYVKYGFDGAHARETLVREKEREDRLRSMSTRFVRWTVGDVREPERLARLLANAGLPRA